MQTAEKSAGWVREDVQVAPRLRLAVFRFGRADADAPAVLLVHGLGHWTQAAWGSLARELGAGYRVIAFDLPGFGESDKPDARYDLRFFTDTLSSLVAALRLDRFALVGHSLGGAIAASYAAQDCGRVALLALIDPAGFRRTARLMFRIALSHPASWLFRLRPSRRFVNSTLARATFDPAAVPAEDRERAFRLALDPACVRAFARVYTGAFADLLHLRALHARLARYRGPVLLFWGRHDRYVPIAALAAAARVYPQAEITVLERSGHLPNLEEPETIAARIRAALPARRGSLTASRDNSASRVT